MSITPAYLEIHVHGVDGNVAAFRQSDPKAAAKLLAHIQPARIFTQHHLTISSPHSIAFFPCAAVARVDLVMDDFPDWPFHHGVEDLVEITEEEFEQRFHPADRPVEPPGAIAVRFGELELTNGERLFLQAYVRETPITPVDQAIVVQQILTAPSLHARRLGGGAVLVNPVHILRMSFYPGPPEPPPNAWAADPLTGLDAEQEF
jgi:hypothetical protein